MSDKPLTVEIPEELLARAQAANIDVRQTLIEALEHKMHGYQPSAHAAGSTRAEIDEFVKQSDLQLASGEVQPRQWGYLKGQIWIADDFDDELSDSFWFGDDE